MNTVKDNAVKDNTVEVLVYRGGINKIGEPCAKTLHLPRVPVAGDKLFITQGEGDKAYAYNVVDVHFIDKGGVCVVVELISDMTSYLNGFVKRGLM